MPPPVKDRAGMLACIASRNRPHQLGRNLVSWLATSTQETYFLVGVDDDDPQIDSYQQWERQFGDDDRVMFMYGPRKPLSAWTNYLARQSRGEARFLLSVGDDHVPYEREWDAGIFLAAAHVTGPAIVFPVDPFTPVGVATAFAVDYRIVAALGWLMHPAMKHYWVDNVWEELAGAAGNGIIAQEAPIVHCHWRHNLGESDPTYLDAETSQLQDHAAFTAWMRDGVARDVATVQALKVAQSAHDHT